MLEALEETGAARDINEPDARAAVEILRCLLERLETLERRTARSGKDTIDHPPGAKDDICNAVAGVVTHIEETGGVRLKLIQMPSLGIA